jgi:hypothetical protein
MAVDDNSSCASCSGVIGRSGGTILLVVEVIAIMVVVLF